MWFKGWDKSVSVGLLESHLVLLAIVLERDIWALVEDIMAWLWPICLLLRLLHHLRVISLLPLANKRGLGWVSWDDIVVDTTWLIFYSEAMIIDNFRLSWVDNSSVWLTNDRLRSPVHQIMEHRFTVILAIHIDHATIYALSFAGCLVTGFVEFIDEFSAAFGLVSVISELLSNHTDSRSGCNWSRSDYSGSWDLISVYDWGDKRSILRKFTIKVLTIDIRS